MRLLIAGDTGTSGRVLTRRARATGDRARLPTRCISPPSPDRQHGELVHGDLTTGGVLRFTTGVRGECTLDQWLTGVR